MTTAATPPSRQARRDRGAADRGRLRHDRGRSHPRLGGAGHRRRPRRAGAHPAVDAQPARLGRRSDRHRQDQDAAGDRRAAVRGRGAGVHPRRQGRPLRPVRARRAQRPDHPARRPRPATTGRRRRTRWSSSAWPGRAAACRCGPPIDSFGPILLSKVLGLNDTQESTLGLIFHWADQRTPAAAGPQGPARGDHAPDQRRGQGGSPRARRGVQGHRRGDPAGGDEPRRPGRRRVLRRARARCVRPAPDWRPTAAG